jgi:hypothetical protein
MTGFDTDQRSRSRIPQLEGCRVQAHLIASSRDTPTIERLLGVNCNLRGLYALLRATWQPVRIAMRSVTFSLGSCGLRRCPEAGQDGHDMEEERLTAEHRQNKAPALEPMGLLAVVTPWIPVQVRSTPPGRRLCRRSSS